MGRNEDKVATTINKTDILNAINDYNTGNDRPCPKTFLAGKFGVDILDMLDVLKKDGSIVGKRGRNGGFVLSANAASDLEVTPVTVETDAVETTDEASNEVPSESNEPVETISQEEADRVFASLTGVTFIPPADSDEQDEQQDDDSLDESAANL